MRWAREREGEKATAMASLLPRHRDITEDEGEWVGVGGRRSRVATRRVRTRGTPREGERGRSHPCPRRVDKQMV